MEFRQENDPIIAFLNKRQDEQKFEGMGRGVQKYLDATTTLEEKTILAQQRRMEKYDNLEGIEQGEVVYAADSDTFSIESPTSGLLKNARIASNRGLFLDAVEVSHPNQHKPNYGLREDGTPKGKGWLGEIPAADGSVITELSSTFNFDGNEILAPIVTPNLSRQEIAHLQSGNAPTDAILDKAAQHAMMRLQAGKSPFRDDDSVADDIYSNANKRVIQPRLVSQLLNKPINELTDEDYNTVGRQSLDTILNRLRSTSELDTPNIEGGLQEGERIPVAFKVIGTDKYNRPLVELINVHTREAVSSNLANDPKFNAAWTVGNVFKTQTRPNRGYENQYLAPVMKEEAKKQFYDKKYGDSAIGNWIDVAQASAYRTMATLMNIGYDHNPESWRYKNNERRRAEGKAGWDDLFNTEVNYVLSQNIAGVNPKVREEHEKTMAEYDKAIEEGNIPKAIGLAVTDLTYTLAESAPSMALLSAGTAASMAAAPFSGGTSIPAYLAVAGNILGGGLYVAQRTKDQMDAYTVANGHPPDEEHIAKAIGWNVLTTFGEQIAIGLGASKLISKPMREAIHAVPKNIIPNAGKGVLFGFGTEFLQEGAEQTGDIYFAQKEDEAKDFIEVIKSKDVLKAAILGGVAGGSIGGTAGVAGGVASIKSNKELVKENELRAKRQKEKETTSYFEGIEVNKQTDERISTVIQSLSNTKKDLERVNNIIASTPDVSRATTDKALIKRNEILKSLAKEDNLPGGITKEDILKDVIFRSDPFGINDVKKVTSETLETRKEQVFEEGKKLGFTEKEITKSFEEVAEDIRVGKGDYLGVQTYKNNIDNLNKRIEKTKPDSPQRKQLEGYRDNIVDDFAKFRESQARKIEGIIHAATEIAESGVPSAKAFGNFVVKGKNLLNDPYNSNRGTHKVMRDLVETVREADKTLSAYNEGNTKGLTSFGNVEARLATYKKALVKIAKKTEGVVTTPTKSAIAKVKEKVTGKEVTPKTKEQVQDTIDTETAPRVIKALRYILKKGEDSSAASTQLTRLRAVYPKAETWVDFKNRYEKLSSPDKDVVALIDRIISKKTEDTETLKKNEEVVKRIKESAKRYKQYYTEEKIESIDDIAKLKAALDRIKVISRNTKEAAALDISEDKELLELGEFYNKVDEQLRVKASELAKTEIQKQVDDAKKGVKSEEEAATEEEETGEDTEEESETLTEKETKKVSQQTGKIVLPIGTSGSGKSTWIKSLKEPFTVISPDEMRVEFTGDMNDKSKDKEIYEEVKNRAMKAVENGEQVIIDTTNLQRDRRRDFINTIKEFFPNVSIEYKLLPLNPELAKERIRKDIESGVDRANVPESTIDRHAELYKQMLEDIKEEAITEYVEETTEEEIEEESETLTEKEIREKHTEAVNTLLESNTNALTVIAKALTEAGKKVVNDIAKELKASPKPGANFIMNEFNLVEYIGKIHDLIGENLDSLYNLTPDLDLAGKGNHIAYLIAGTEDSNTWNNDPALGLIYDIKVEGNKVRFKPKDNVFAAIDFSLREYFSTMSLSKTLRPFENDMIQSIFQIDLYNSALFPDYMPIEDKYEKIREHTKNARKLVQEHGIPRTYITNKIGETILDNLGLTRNKKTGTVNFYDKLAESLGVLAVKYAVDAGLLTESSVDPKDIAFMKAKRNIPFIKMTEENESNIKAFRLPYLELKETYKVKGNDTTGPTLEPSRVPNDMQVQGTKGLSIVPRIVRGVMQKIFGTPYNINSELADNLFITNNIKESKKLREKVLKQLGWVPDDVLQTLPKTARESQIGKNRQAEHDYDTMFDLIKQQKESGKDYTDYYFNYSMTRGGRYNMISNTVNPQSSKFHRFLMLPAEIERTYTVGNESQLHLTYFALAQAFDSLTNLGENETTLDHITNVGKNIMAEDASQMITDLINDYGTSIEVEIKGKLKTVDKFVHKYEHTGIDGVENFSQALLALQHVKNYQRAVREGRSSFESFLAVENDSTTSGYAIRTLQMPHADNLKFAPKLGILRGKDGYNTNNGLLTIHELKGSKEFLDIYKTMASATGEKLKGIEIKEGTKYYKQYEDSKFSKQALSQLFEMMVNNLPTPNDDGTVTSALRKLLKVAAIPFGYTAGEHSITSSLSESIMNDFISHYIKAVQSGLEFDKLSAEQQTAVNLFEFINKNYYRRDATYFETVEGRTKPIKADTLYDALMNVDINDIRVQVQGKTVSLDGLFDRVLVPTYGKAVWESLSESFETTITYNESLNHMIRTMFVLFNDLFEKKMADLRKEYGNNVPIQEEQKVILSLFDLFPAMKLPYNTFREGLFESALLFDTEKVSGEDRADAHIQTLYGTNKGISTISSYADVRRFIDAGQAGAVLPIHFMDGMIMSLVLNKFGDKILGVHDAFIMSALDNIEVTQEANKVMYLLSKQFDIFNTVRNQFEDSIKTYEKLTNEINKIEGFELTEAIINFKTGEVIPEGDMGRYNIDDIDGKNVLNLSVMKDRANKLDESNRKARDEFFYGPDSTDTLIVNIDGAPGIGYKVDGSTIAEHQLYEVINDIMTGNYSIVKRGSKEAKIIKKHLEKYGSLGSDPSGWVPNSKLEFYKKTGADSVKTRLQIADDLRKLDPKGVTDKEFAFLKDVIINRVNPEHLNKLVVTFEDSHHTVGKLEGNHLAIGIDEQTNVDPLTRLSIYSNMSTVEIFAHELVHAGTRLSIVGHKALKLTKEIHELLTLQRRASKIVTWEDFMPDVYDPSLESFYKERAEKIWSYIFDNPNIDNLEGLNEFVAYGLTHKKMKQKLESVYLDTSNIADKAKFLDRLVSLAKVLLDVFSGKENFKELFQTSARVLKGDLNLRNKEMIYTELVRLNDKLNGINQNTVKKLQNTPISKLQDMFEFLWDIIVNKGNKLFSPYVKYAKNFVDELGLSYTPSGQQIHGSVLEPAKALAWMLLAWPFSATRRAALPTAVKRIFNLSQQSVFSSIVREVQTPDRESATLERLSAIVRMTDSASKAVESDYYKELYDSFDMRDAEGKKRYLTDLEQNALTEAFILTDLSCLADVQDGKTTNIDYILDLLKDEKLVQNYIDTEIQALEKTIKDKNQYNWYVNSAKGLAHYMVTGKGVMGQNLNARNIATGRMTGHTKWANVSEDVVNTIDRLATFYALSYTDKNSKLLAASLTKEGLAHMLNIHKSFVQETREENIVESIHEVKGYYKSLTDNSIDMKVAPVDNELEMKKAGYTQVKILGRNDFTNTEGLAIYLRKWNTPEHREGAAFGITSRHAIGTSLKESAYATAAEMEKAIGRPIKIKEIMNMHNAFFTKAHKEANNVISVMQARELSIRDIQNLATKNGGYMPIASPLGGISDFRITMSIDDKVEFLKMRKDAFEILSKMYASKNAKISFKTKNDIIVKFLETDMRKNMLATHRTREGKEYIRLTPDTDNAFLKEAYKAIPKELREAIKKYDQQGEGFWVRDEWLDQLFGTPSVSVVDNKLVAKYTNASIKKIILITEHILKAVAYMAKQNLIIRYFPVLMGNVMSNINLSIAFGGRPDRVIKKTIENTQHIRDYVDNRKARDRILIKQKLKTATKEELASLNWYETKLANNPLDGLMKKGMYQSIIEDISPKELESVGKVSKLLSTKLKNIPKPVKTIAKHLYMTEGTPIFDFMFQATQYSDFVARATEYQLQMEKVEYKRLKSGKLNPDFIERYERDSAGNIKKDKEGRYVETQEWFDYEEKVTNHVWSAFINYDKPQSSKEQYLNDIGLIMFTKFLKRIQRVIVSGFAEAPVSSLLFLLSQSVIGDVSDINEYAIFNRDLSYNFFNPITDNLISAMFPVAGQLALGVGPIGD